MVIDTSALMAILQGEPEAKVFAEAIEAQPVRLISAVSILEAGILAVSRKGARGTFELDALVAASGAQTVPFDEEQAQVARTAFERFGKGRHAASLNFGDCAVYGLAATTGEPLLFKGNDFNLTDLALYAPD